MRANPFKTDVLKPRLFKTEAFIKQFTTYTVKGLNSKMWRYIAFVIGARESVKIAVDIVANHPQGCVFPFGLQAQAIGIEIVNLARTGTQQIEHPAIGALLFFKLDLLMFDLRQQHIAIDHFNHIAHHLREIILQTLGDNQALLVAVSVPMNHFMGKTLAAATDLVAYASRANTDTGSFNGFV